MPSCSKISRVLPCYRQDNLFGSTAFATRFPEFEVTTYREGVGRILEDGAS
ncbi:hypothetical protein [Nocardioides acrostichi]|uniref:Uncharacterized protein n=1 Tax=Nocardioides acrostichi TaxID=2784339 RepID=A0A930Y7F4_9ACTN|nr:hypothetical protein [Nocardioides acrostichi]MBF4161977.1 hypothetical protein [Nocardioides acrostichi]